MTGSWRVLARGRARVAVPLLAVLLLTAFQVRTGAWWGTGWRPNPIREGLPLAENGVTNRAFTFCRLLYQHVGRENGGHGWNTDYPGSDFNFVQRLEELTTTHAARWSDGEPGYAVVRPTQDELYECPFIFMSDVGTARFSEIEVARLRDYLLKGGFIWADDFWGSRAWNQWAAQLARILPEHQIVDLGPDHELFSALYVVKGLPQIPSIQFWRRNGGRTTSERGSDSASPHLRAVFDEYGRPLVLMTHNTDIADGWEREGEEDDYFYAYSPDAYAFGVNLVVYALSH